MTTAPVPPTLISGPDPARGPGAWRRLAPGISGCAYVLAWVAGLAAWPVNLALNATSAQVSAAFRLHPAEAVTQLVLVEGLAAILLAVVLVGMIRAGLLTGPGARNARRGAATHSAATIGAATLSAATVGAAALAIVAVGASLAQCGVGLAATWAAVHHQTSSCGELTALLNRLDGVKQLALAAIAAWLAAASALRRWLRILSVLVAAALAVSGCAFLALANSLGWSAFLSGPLLLAWVASTGIWLSRPRRPQGAG
jgi:hypothetical protein